MWSILFALAMGILFMAISDTSQPSPAGSASTQSTQADKLAGDMLRSASAINDWRYAHTLSDGDLTLSQFVVPAPDSAIHATVSGGRLWIWSPAFAGLQASLLRKSSGSALALTVTGGHLLMADGTDMNLSLPSGVTEGNVVYLN